MKDPISMFHFHRLRCKHCGFFDLESKASGLRLELKIHGCMIPGSGLRIHDLPSTLNPKGLLVQSDLEFVVLRGLSFGLG